MEDPVEIPYKKWRHRVRKSIVQVTAVHHYRGHEGCYYTTVTVEGRSSPHPVVWPSKVFLETFEPVGRKIKIKSAWERLK